MSESNHLRWLHQQVSDWVSEQLISEEQAEKILTRYPAALDTPDHRNRLAYLILGIIATLLVGSGIVLVFAYQWESIGLTSKRVLSFVPVFLGLGLFVYTWLYRRSSLVWRESVSGFFMLMIAATIGLLAQTFELLQTSEEYWIIWLVCSLPLIYLLNSSFCALLYCFGLTGWVLEEDWPDQIYFWLFLLALIPHLWYHLRSRKEIIRQNLLEWATAITLTICWFALMHSSLEDIYLFATALLFGLLFLVGAYTGLRDHLLVRPWQLFAMIGSFILIIIMGFNMDLTPFNWQAMWNVSTSSRWAIRIHLLVIGLMVIIWGIFLVREGLRREKDVFYRLFLVFPLVVLALLLLHQSGQHAAATLLGNITGLLFGAIYLRAGIERDSMLYINLGMLMILALAATRFFDTDWSMLVKGILFIGLGLVFLGINIWLSRKA